MAAERASIIASAPSAWPGPFFSLSRAPVASGSAKRAEPSATGCATGSTRARATFIERRGQAFQQRCGVGGRNVSLPHAAGEGDRIGADEADGTPTGLILPPTARLQYPLDAIARQRPIAGHGK